MKILFINAVCGVGSTGRIVIDLMHQAKKQGHIVKVACSSIEPIKGVESNEVIIVGNKNDYYVHNALSKLTDHEGLYSKAATKKLIKQIREFNPDIVHLHNIHGHWINYEYLFGYLAEEGKKVIWTLHDCWAFTGHCSHFSLLNCEQWKTHCSSCKGLQIYPVCYGKGDANKNFERKRTIFNSVKDMTIVTPSKWLADLVKQSFLGDHTIIVIHNKIDNTVFKPTKSDFRKRMNLDGKNIILAVANVWNKEKGYDDFLKLPDLLGDSFAYVMVGLNEDQIKSLPITIIGIQRTQNTTELAQLYTAADVFVNLSYQDNFPTVNLESISCGTPVISYKTGGSCEAFDSNSGIEVDQGDVLGVARAIKKAVMFDHEVVRQRSMVFDEYGDYRPLYTLDGALQ